MAHSSAEKVFTKMLRRTVVLPLIFAVLTAGTLIGLVFYLLASARSVDHSDQVIAVGGKYLRLIIDSETGVRGFLLYGQEQFLQPLQEARTELPQLQARLRTLLAQDSMDLSALDRIGSMHHEWMQSAEQSVDDRRHGKPFGDGLSKKVFMDGIRHEFETFLQRQETLRDDRAHHTDQIAGGAVFATLVLSLLLAGLFISLSRSQLRALSVEYETALRAQGERNALLRDSDWLKSGLAEFGQRLLGELSLEEISTNALRYVIERAGADLGAFYGAREGRFLVRLAGHGLPLDGTGLPKEVAYGETLLGQAARDRKPQFLTAMEAYPLRAETGLTSVAPRALALVPIVADGSLKGVLELGFLQEYSPRTRDFLLQVADLMGQALKSAEYRHQLVQLLEESQRQAEELNIQGEELKQTNENLEQQSHEMQAQQALLEQTNNELEAQQIAMQEKREELERNNRQLETMHASVREQADRLALASRYKSEFLANMSHELRTPLNSILILAKLLEDQPEDVRGTKESATTIHSSALDLLSLINDILDLSKIEAGRLEIHPQRMPLAPFAEKLRRLFAPVAESRGLDFKVELADNLPTEIVCDEMRLEQILRNFISNGLKFTEHGSVTVELHGATDRAIEIAVRDTGIGIPPDKQALIFEAFEQIDGSDARRYGGTGLGLTIARRLSQLLGAQISVSSRVGAGSVFTLLVPTTPPISGPEISSETEVVRTQAPPPAPPPPADSAPPSKPMLRVHDDRARIHRRDHVVQIIEDDVVFANHLMELVRSRGFKTVVSSDGASGLQDARHVEPDAILLDLRLPEMDGMELLQKLKADEKTANIPVHVISSAAEQRASALEKGAVEFLAKPASVDAIGSILARVESRRNEKGDVLNRVLIVEDSAPDREALTKLLTSRGLHVASTDRVARAKEIYLASQYDLVLVDLALADGSGFELLDFLRHQDGRRCGVIVYTARDLTTPEKERLSDSTDTIVVKGAKSMERLLQEVTLFLRGVEREMPAGTRPASAATVAHRDETMAGKVALVVDDDMRNVYALRRVLDSRGMQVLVGRTGKEALQRLEEASHVDVILMDVMMPEMDGLEAIRRIRTETRFSKVPILALTAKAMAGDRERCLQAGADDYLPKPVDFDRLLGLVKVWVNKV